MRKLRVPFCILFLAFGSSFSFGQSWLWAREGINNTNSTVCDPTSIATDDQGNVFETGGFVGSITFGNDTIASIGVPGAILVKYDSNGNFLWAWNAKDANRNSVSNALSVTTDNIGNSYITGSFIDTVIFGAFKLTSKNTDVFLVKFAPNGNVLWAKTSKEINGGLGCEGFSVTTDRSSNVYIAGQFRDTISFGSDTVITNNLNRYYAFLVKYDSNGNALWLKSAQTGVATAAGINYSITTDSNKNIYLTGTFFDTASFGPYILTTISPLGSIFLVKYDSNGNVKWAKSGIGANLSYVIYYNESNSIVTDRVGNIYITGQLLDTITFGSYKLNTNINLQRDIFFVKYDTAGDIIWAQCGKPPLSGGPGGPGYSLSMDKWNHIYLTGSFQDTISFGSLKLVSNAPMPSCIFKFDTSGAALCGTYIDNLNDDANAIAASPLGSDIYFGGDVGMGDCIFGNDTLHDGGSSEYLFIAKWQPCNNTITSVNSVTEKNSIAIFPNPNNGVFTIQSSVAGGPLSVEVYNVLGKKVLTEALLSPQGDNVINLSDNPSGVYLYRVLNKDGGSLGSGKVIIDK